MARAGSGTATVWPCPALAATTVGSSASSVVSPARGGVSAKFELGVRAGTRDASCTPGVRHSCLERCRGRFRPLHVQTVSVGASIPRTSARFLAVAGGSRPSARGDLRRDLPIRERRRELEHTPPGELELIATQARLRRTDHAGRGTRSLSPRARGAKADTRDRSAAARPFTTTRYCATGGGIANRRNASNTKSSRGALVLLAARSPLREHFSQLARASARAPSGAATTIP